MPTHSDEIVIAEDDPQVGQTVETALLQSLRDALPQGRNTSFVLSARTPGGDLVGGLTAGTSYGWLLVKTLWVAETHRGQGIGRSLMEQAEKRARAVGCHGSWLDTSSPDAMRFYSKLGYTVFGLLENATGQHPADHRRWFMNKAL